MKCLIDIAISFPLMADSVVSAHGLIG